MPRVFATAALACAAVLAACDAVRTTDRPITGPTGTTPGDCDSTGLHGLTYASFGQQFFSTYCTRCHGTDKTGDARNGAPADHNFDSLAGVKQFAAEIDQVAAWSPDEKVQNVFMPFGGSPPVPTAEQRKQLACFIAEGLAP